jgi:hypothetical protein
MAETDNQGPVPIATPVSTSTHARRGGDGVPRILIGQDAMTVADIFDLAQPALAEGVTLEQFLATDDRFNLQQVTEPHDGSVQFRQLALEPLIG